MMLIILIMKRSVLTGCVDTMLVDVQSCGVDTLIVGATSVLIQMLVMELLLIGRFDIMILPLGILMLRSLSEFLVSRWDYLNYLIVNLSLQCRLTVLRRKSRKKLPKTLMGVYLPQVV